MESQDHNTTQERRYERYQRLQVYQSTFPHLQTVHMDTAHPKKKKKKKKEKEKKEREKQQQMEKVLDENQPRTQACFRKGYLAVEYLQTISQLIENIMNQ